MWSQRCRGGKDRQREVFDGTVLALKWIFLSLPGETKDLFSVNKLILGEGDWACEKEDLGLLIDMEGGMVALPERKHLKLL